MIHFEPPYIIVLVFFALGLLTGACLGGIISNSAVVGRGKAALIWTAVAVPTLLGIFGILFLGAAVQTYGG